MIDHPLSLAVADSGSCSSWAEICGAKTSVSPTRLVLGGGFPVAYTSCFPGWQQKIGQGIGKLWFWSGILVQPSARGRGMPEQRQPG